MIFKNDKKDLVLKKVCKKSLRKEKNLLLVDVETCNDQKIILDFSYMIISCKTGLVVDRNTYIIKESWETKSIVNGIYSKSKKKDYKKMLKEKRAILIDKQHFYNKLNKLIKDFDIKIFMAYNGKFDLEAIYNTFDYENKHTKLWKLKCWRGGNLKPLFRNLDLLDLWTYASVFYKTKDFKKWYDTNICEYTKTGNRKTNAEIMYRYLKENKFLVETHLAQEDLDIEYQIFMSCVWKQPNKMVLLNYSGLWGAWKLAQNARYTKNDKLYQKLILLKI
jgi:hypothetical protein